MSQHFVEENRRRPSAQQSRPVVWLRNRRLSQCLQIARHLFDLFRQFLFVRQSCRRRRLKCLHAQQIHSVLGTRLRFHHQSRRVTRRRNRRPFAVHHPLVRTLHLQHDRREIDLRILPERRRQSPDLSFPRRLIERRHRQRVARVLHGSLFRKIRRLILFFRSHRRVRLHIQKRRSRRLGRAIRQLPERSRNRVLVFAEGKCP